MKKEIRVVKEGVTQITTYDERWYTHEIDFVMGQEIKIVDGVKTIVDKTVKKTIFVPSVTWVCGYYPKGLEFYRWLANKGWDESEAIKSAAGDKGSKIHAAIADLIKGEKIKMDSQYMNPSTGQLEELSLEEYAALMTFCEWYEEFRPNIIASEFVLFSDENTPHAEWCKVDTELKETLCTCKYAGTGDILVEKEDCFELYDVKSGKYIWPEYELQTSAYARVLEATLNIGKEKIKPVKRFIIQVGYTPNKKKQWKVTELEDKFELFQGAQKVWYNENKDVHPKQKDYPDELKLNKP